jgi:hypothetical protein
VTPEQVTPSWPPPGHKQHGPGTPIDILSATREQQEEEEEEEPDSRRRWLLLLLLVLLLLLIVAVVGVVVAGGERAPNTWSTKLVVAGSCNGR